MNSSNPMLNFFQRFRVPLNRKKLGVIEYLNNDFLKFKKEFGILLDNQSKDNVFDKQIYIDLSKNHDYIIGFYQGILDSLNLLSNGNILKALQTFENKMLEMQNEIMSSQLKGTGILNHFYRIRTDKGGSREDLFHIPSKKQEKIKAYRYSIAGFPCLYLAGSKGPDTGLALAWLECSMPNKFYWSEFRLADSAQNLQVLDLTESPFSSSMKAQNFYTWALRKENFISNLVKRNIATYPLLASCSLTVENKNENFIPEYIVPQMLLSWVHQSDNLRGIKYFSCTHEEEARKYNAFNIALPPKEFSDDGYCSRLSKEFTISTPHLIDVSEIASNDNKAIAIMQTPSTIERTEYKFLCEQ